jgi:hypothetical protein
MTRARYRYVKHAIRHEPTREVMYEACCTAPGCEAKSGPQKAQEAAQDWALAHAGLNPGHDLFRRVFTDHALVTRAE